MKDSSYTPAIYMALNASGHEPLVHFYDIHKDLWEVTILLGDLWREVHLDGSFVRSCFKHLKNGGKIAWVSSGEV